MEASLQFNNGKDSFSVVVENEVHFDSRTNTATIDGKDYENVYHVTVHEHFQ